MKMLIVLLSVFLVGCTGPAYEANFIGTNLGCCIVRDTFTPNQVMNEGRSKLPGETHNLKTADGALQMVTAPPAGTTSGVASTIGVYRTQLSLAPGRRFLVTATFQRPARTLTVDSWSVLVIVRESNTVDDTANDGRLQLSLRTKEDTTGARSVVFRVQEGDPAATAGGIPGASFDLTGSMALADIDASLPFKMSLILNREDGTGQAYLATEHQIIPISFNTSIFTQSTSAPILNTAGAVLANTGVGLPASVEVTHFEIWSS